MCSEIRKELENDYKDKIEYEREYLRLMNKDNYIKELESEIKQYKKALEVIEGLLLLITNQIKN